MTSSRRLLNVDDWRKSSVVLKNALNISSDDEQRTGAKFSFSPTPIPMNLSTALLLTRSKRSWHNSLCDSPDCKMSLRISVWVRFFVSGLLDMKSRAMSNDLRSLLYESLIIVHPYWPSITSRRIATASSSGMRRDNVSGDMPRYRQTEAHVMAFSIAPSFILCMVNDPEMLSFPCRLYV